MTDYLKHAQRLYLALVYILLYLPLLVLILYSFNDAQYTMKFKAFTLRWYYAAFDDQALWDSLSNSAILALFSSTITTAIAALSATTMHFFPPKSKTGIQQSIFLLILIPDIILAVGFLVFFNVSHMPLGFVTLLIAHITFSLPFALLIIQNRLKKISKLLFAAGQDLGATDAYTFKTVILPLIKTAVMSSFLICFTLSFDDVLISYFTAGPTFQILPLYIYSLIRSGITPEINALCTMVFLFSLLITLSAFAIPKYFGRIQTKEIFHG